MRAVAAIWIASLLIIAVAVLSACAPIPLGNCPPGHMTCNVN